MPAPTLAERIGHTFSDAGLLRQALTHRSHGADHNERLEFLGDSVLSCVVAEALFHRYPDLPEGDLSRARARLVQRDTLFEFARSIDLGDELLLGEGELRSGGRERPSILADALEAVIGAVFMDGGLAAARDVVLGFMGPLLDEVGAGGPEKDPKTLLQEHLQGRRIALPVYRIVATAGVAHRQRFTVECAVDSLGIKATGQGTSRRAAEQRAARSAYESILRGRSND